MKGSFEKISSWISGGNKGLEKNLEVNCWMLILWSDVSIGSVGQTTMSHCRVDQHCLNAWDRSSACWIAKSSTDLNQSSIKFSGFSRRWHLITSSIHLRSRTNGTMSNSMSATLSVVSRPTMYMIFYLYLDFFIDHLYFQTRSQRNIVQQCTR